jgi:cation diffusion facilitator family transporter
VWAAAHRVFDPQPLEQVGLGLTLSVASSFLNGVLAWFMFGAARVHRSTALDADARHLVTDVWTSAGVVLGIGLVHVTGWLWLDAVVAMAVALNILKEGVHLVWGASQGLMDEAVEPEVLAQIQQVLQDFSHTRESKNAVSTGVMQIVRFDHVTTRKAGQRRFVDMHMHMPADWSLGRAAALRTSVEQALMSAVPGLRASIQLLPSDVEAHFDDARDLI